MISTCEHDRITQLAIKKLGCDAARISTVGDKSFLIIGRQRTTEQDRLEHGVTTTDGHGKVLQYTYLNESAIASGKSAKRLLLSLLKYTRLHRMSKAGWTLLDYARYIGRGGMPLHDQLAS